ncbi:hypothetical protein BV22DRAFT_1072333 [Leucogyrophana mollusca]|uniref:Uncharacterized protein n=1 Tax=Leucogyrophana mollusca TaxID=85980 RepID=A0ACB8B923_9AGAM|nr:hypothetical protein BV22DRAFT_1072333 [Leucogyrophana mollusca]
MSVDIHTVKVAAIATHSVPISITVLRLLYRWYTGRFWWEDAWAALALLFDIVCLVCTWIQVQIFDPDVVPVVDTVSIWIISVAFSCVVWSARLSVIFSIIRVVNPAPRLRRFAHCVAVAFGVMWIALVAQKVYSCSSHLLCTMGRDVAISQLITDSISDIILVALPFPLLQSVKLSRSARILISCAFSASLFITAATIPFSALLCTDAPVVAAIIVAHIQAALALMICNLLVIVTFAYRVFHKNDDSGDLDRSFVGGGGTAQFTTIILTLQPTIYPHANCEQEGDERLDCDGGRELALAPSA